MVCKRRERLSVRLKTRRSKAGGRVVIDAHSAAAVRTGKSECTITEGRSRVNDGLQRRGVVESAKCGEADLAVDFVDALRVVWRVVGPENQAPAAFLQYACIPLNQTGFTWLTAPRNSL